jgi:hypothetical protein
MDHIRSRLCTSCSRKRGRIYSTLYSYVTYEVDNLDPEQAVSEKPAKRQKLTVMPESMTTTSTEFRADQLQALLPSVWGLLNSLPSDEQVELLDALLAYYNRLGARSPAKHIALGFIARMFLVRKSVKLKFMPDYHIDLYYQRFNSSHNTMECFEFTKTQLLPRRCVCGFSLSQSCYGKLRTLT